MENNNTNKVSVKKIRLFLFIPVILWMMVIFWFSANNGDESSSQSAKITYGVTTVFDKLFHLGMSEGQKMQMSESMTLMVRKTAHFCEYMILAMLVRTALAGVFLRLGVRMQYALTLGWVFSYAALDELHQYFVPGRCCSIWDVLVDTAGGLTGILIIMAVRHFRKGSAYNRL
ncbi:MAG: VanZ family protein [Lachnospiraceae bacterium]